MAVSRNACFGRPTAWRRSKSGFRPGTSPIHRPDYRDRAGREGRVYQTISARYSWQTLAVPTPVAGLYKMSIFDPKVSFGLRVPKNLPFVLKGGFISTSQSPKVYFFVRRTRAVCPLWGWGHPVLPV